MAVTDPRELIAGARRLGDPLSGTSLYCQLADALEKALDDARVAVDRLLARRGQAVRGAATLQSEIDAVFEDEARDDATIESLQAECKRLREALDVVRKDVDGYRADYPNGCRFALTELALQAIGKDGGT